MEWKNLDEQMLKLSLECTEDPTTDGIVSAEDVYNRFQLIKEVCDAAALRLSKSSLYVVGHQPYWWNNTIADLRKNCIRARRKLTRERRKKQPIQPIENLVETYKLARKKLNDEIKRAKSMAWQELIESVEKEPWGLPYKIVLTWLKQSSQNFPEIIARRTLADILKIIFPDGVTFEGRKLEEEISKWNGAFTGKWRKSMLFTKKKRDE